MHFAISIGIRLSNLTSTFDLLQRSLFLLES